MGLALQFASPASAAIADGVLAGRATLEDNALIENVAYVYGGRNYCFYDDGWKGTGWYWCGHAWSNGVGWGGAYGWRGWTHAGYRGAAYYRNRVAHHRGAHGGRYGGARVAHHGAHRGGGGGARVGHHGGFRGGGGGARVGHHGGGRGGRGGGGGRRRSDLRLKYDVVLLGHLQDGLGYYRFTYIDDHTPYVGVLAQEVLTVMPDAVTRGADGFLRVSYDKLGIPFETYDHWRATGSRLPTPK
jgi:hypothetical protein